MPDYGHPLRFGSFVSPAHATPRRPVDLAVLSEDLGLDLVTFQDHPYQASFHDTWTLLTWVAARTSRIHVAGNVLNLPLRPPAVLARALASLDLLSDGRAELGIGTGGYFDAIGTMTGAPALTPGDAVTALDEALDVIRGIWDVADPTPLHTGGEHHRVAGAARGPAPAHDIPIWVGARQRRMQQLIGRKADGWLPSLPWLKPGDLAAGNRVIDEAARAAGRDPRAITRLLNVTPQYSAAALAERAIEDGVAVFILASDDPAELRRFAEVTAPEIRDRVGEARSRGGSVPAPRAARSFRGDPVPAALAERAILPSDRGYARYTSGFFRGARPGMVLRPQTTAEVQEAVRFAARHRDVPLGLFSGGHGLSGRSLNDGGLVLALDALNEIAVTDHRVRVGPGAHWAEVAQALAPHGLAITAGDAGGVGVGGLATTAGIGWFAREHGLTIDLLRAVDVVTATGDLVHASATEHPDLFWAMRGAGANFGVAVSFEFDAHPVPGQVGFAILVFAPDDVAAFLEGWGAAIEAAHPSVTGTLMTGPGRRGVPGPVHAIVVVDSDDPDVVLERLQPLADLAPLADHAVRMTSYAGLLTDQPGAESQHGQGEPHSHAGLVRHLTPEIAAGLADLLASGSPFLLSVRSAGGAVGATPADATAYAWRDANFLLVTLGGGSADFERRWAELVPLFEGMYLSFETDTGPDVVARAFPPEHLKRLRALKREWDPDMLFRDNFPIDPDAD